MSFPEGNESIEKMHYEIKKDTMHLEQFFDAMRHKMKSAVLEKGRYGWETLSIEQLEELFEGHYLKYKERGGNRKDAVDLGNIAMMLYFKCQA